MNYVDDPIGVFDSGLGGLSVLKKTVGYNAPGKFHILR